MKFISMYLFILESLGMSELILIGIVALIIFGPRKLPEMMKKFGSVMAEFKRTTNEFKESWEREVSFENLEKQNSEEKKLLENNVENSIGRESYPLENEIVAPEIKEIKGEEFEPVVSKNDYENPEGSETEKVSAANEAKNDLNNKRDWL